MMDRWKRRLAALLAALMLVSLAPTAALAEERAEVPPDAVMAEENRPAVSEAAEESEPNAAQTRKAGADSAEDQAQAMSLLPLEEVELRLDLNDAGIFWSELDAVPVSMLLDLTDSSGEKIQAEEGDVILWSKMEGRVYADDDDLTDTFAQVGLDGTIDLTPLESSTSSYITLHLIVGKPDQLRTTNTRYIVQLHLPTSQYLEDIFDVTGCYLPKEGEESNARTPINYADIWYGRNYIDNLMDVREVLVLEVPQLEWQEENDMAVKMALKAPYDTLTPLAYYGGFSTQEELDAAIEAAKNSKTAELQPGADITDQLFAQGDIGEEGGYTLYAEGMWEDEFTVALKRGDKVVSIIPFQYEWEMTDNVSSDWYVYDPESPTSWVGEYDGHEYVEVDDRRIAFQVYDMWSVDAECLFKASYGDYVDGYWSDQDYTQYVEKVVASKEKFYTNFQDTEELPDIKDDFFGDGYKADYSEGIYFSIFSKAESRHLIATVAVKTRALQLGTEIGKVCSSDGWSVAQYDRTLSGGGTSVFVMEADGGPADGTYRYATKVLFNGSDFSSMYSRSGDLADYVEKAVASPSQYYDSVDAAKDQADIKEKLLYFKNISEAGGYKADFSNGVYFTIFWKNGTISKFTVKTVPYEPEVSASKGMIFTGVDTVANWERTTYDDTISFRMTEEKYPADGRYRYRSQVLLDGDPAGSGATLADYVEKAVVDTDQYRYYRSLEDAKDLADIKDELLYLSSPDEAEGYEADYSKGVWFTVFWKDGTISQIKVETLPYVVTPIPAASRSTYFHVNGAKKIDDEETQSKTSLSAWAMPDTVDGYYRGYAADSTNYGVQTVFLLDGSGPVAEGAKIYPTFVTGNGVTVYAGHRAGNEGQTDQVEGDTQTGNSTQPDGEPSEPGQQISGGEQISGESAVTFTSGEAIQYSAAAEDPSMVKNYWVTFATQQSGAKLYANGHIDELKDKEKEDGNPVRNVQLDADHNFYHDIFFANIGDEPLEGLSVELNATNVELDPYWTVGETKILAPFTTVEERDENGNRVSVGMLPNVAKIRLLPKTNADGVLVAGDIEGSITIKSTNGGELTFDLTGKSQGAKIVTDTLMKGVKYVPYNSMIQTDVMGASDAVTFTYTGKLPEGVTLFPNGKLYGVPTGEAGDYTFTVTATATYQGANGANFKSIDSREFTLTVLDNTAENVDAATDEGYELLDRVDDLVTGYTEQVFRSNGDLSQFMYFYLDGVELKEDEDYTAEEGSTRIVIQGQALRSRGSGTHTLAAEFRTNSSDTNTVKRAAQNYTVPGGSGSGTSGRSSSTISEITTPKEPEKGITFQDVKTGAWYYDDVMAVAKSGLMIGVGDELFAPDALISQPMVVTILSRMAKAELPEADDVTGTGVEAGQWYTPAAVWAWRSGIVGDGTFAAVPPLSRGDLATTLARYLDYASVADPAWETADATFADEDQMTDEQLEAFRKLYAIGILKGVGGDYMAPERATSRAELATVVQRLSAYLENQ